MRHFQPTTVPPAQSEAEAISPRSVRLLWSALPHSNRLHAVSTLGQIVIRRLLDADARRAIMNAPNLLPTASTHQQLSNSPTAVSETPALPGRSGKIQPWHLERLAIVYVRQSSQYQVVHNKESAEVQRLPQPRDGLGLAVLTGHCHRPWPGQNATSAEARTGFQWILTEVNLNHVGIILGFQVSRLSPMPIGTICWIGVRSSTPSWPTSTASTTRPSTTTGYCWA